MNWKRSHFAVLTQSLWQSGVVNKMGILCYKPIIMTQNVLNSKSISGLVMTSTICSEVSTWWIETTLSATAPQIWSYLLFKCLMRGHILGVCAISNATLLSPKLYSIILACWLVDQRHFINFPSQITSAEWPFSNFGKVICTHS